MEWIDVHARWPWLRGQRVHVVAADREPAVRADLAADGFRCLTLNGTAVVDPPGFFAAAAKGFGFPAHFGANWDAFRDGLGDLDAATPSRRLALLWTAADTFVRSDLGAFVAAVTTFDDVARDLGAARRDGRSPLQLEVFVVSHGPGAA